MIVGFYEEGIASIWYVDPYPEPVIMCSLTSSPLSAGKK